MFVTYYDESKTNISLLSVGVHLLILTLVSGGIIFCCLEWFTSLESLYVMSKFVSALTKTFMPLLCLTSVC